VPGPRDLVFEQRVEPREDIATALRHFRITRRAVEEVHLVQREMPPRPVFLVHGPWSLDCGTSGSNQALDHPQDRNGRVA